MRLKSSKVWIMKSIHIENNITKCYNISLFVRQCKDFYDKVVNNNWIVKNNEKWIIYDNLNNIYIHR